MGKNWTPVHNVNFKARCCLASDMTNNARVKSKTQIVYKGAIIFPAYYIIWWYVNLFDFIVK